MQELKRAANLALTGIEATLRAIVKMPMDRSRRNLLAATLLRASMDHGCALAFLVSCHPDEFGAPALALHRSQIETLMRGAFFAKEATDEEVTYFIENDDMPKRRDENGRLKRLNPKDIAPLVSDILSLGDSKKVINLINNSWDMFCGMVHGGMHLVMTYNNQGVGFHVEPKSLMEIVGNTLGMSSFAMIGVAAISTANKQQLSDIFQEPQAAHMAYVEATNAV
ncbi:MAG: hypothetical protein ABI114_10880 [Rhodanobacter sp.]